jgi:hypothetical protein
MSVAWYDQNLQPLLFFFTTVEGIFLADKQLHGVGVLRGYHSCVAVLSYNAGLQAVVLNFASNQFYIAA